MNEFAPDTVMERFRFMKSTTLLIPLRHLHMPRPVHFSKRYSEAQNVYFVSHISPLGPVKHCVPFLPVCYWSVFRERCFGGDRCDVLIKFDGSECTASCRGDCTDACGGSWSLRVCSIGYGVAAEASSELIRVYGPKYIS